MSEKISEKIFKRISEVVNLEPIDEFKDIETFKALDGRDAGIFRAYKGEKIKKFSIAEISVAPGMTYFNVGIKPETNYNISTFAINYMEMPDKIQFDVDLYPAVDLVEHQDFIDKYYEQLNGVYMEARKSEDFQWKPSDFAWMRARTSPYFFMSPAAKEKEDKVHNLINAYLEVWIQMYQNEKPVSEEMAKAIEYRKKCMIEVLREKEPDKTIIQKVFGNELTERLAEAMM